MSSIRWSALFLSLAAPLACAPHYDVGDADGASADAGTGGSSTTGGAGGDSTGGTSMTGGSGGSGGKSTTGGTGGSGEGGSNPTGGTGGMGTPGGTGGDSAATGGFAGTGMMPPVPPACGTPADFEYATLPDPEDAWGRVSRLLYDEVREPPSELPDETTVEWIVDILRQALEQSRQASATEQAALTPFMRRFLEWNGTGNAMHGGPAPSPIDETHADFWARMVSGEDSRLGILFEGDAESNPPFGFFGTAAATSDGISRRGNFLTTKLFCQEGPLPPDSLPVEPVVAGPGQTRRQALEEARIEPVCAGCHASMDPLGYPLEVLTPGSLEYRTTENGVPIDTSGSYSGVWEFFEFSDLESLGAELSVSCEVARCFATQLLNLVAPQDDVAYTEAELERALYLFAAPDSSESEQFRFQALLEAIVTTPSFLD
jgi:hypothetical protein